jgi:hypothetical protein
MTREAGTARTSRVLLDAGIMTLLIVEARSYQSRRALSVDPAPDFT